MSDGTQFSVRCATEGQVLRIVVEGELDMATETPLLEAAHAAMTDTAATRIVLDTTPLTFVDSSGLRALLLTRDRAKREDLPITLAVVDGPVTRLLEAAGVADWFSYE